MQAINKISALLAISSLGIASAQITGFGDVKTSTMEIEYFKNHVSDAEIWFLTPADARWTSLTWEKIEGTRAANIKKNFSKAKPMEKAGDFYLLDISMRDRLAILDGLILFVIPEKSICFRKRSNHISKMAVELVALEKFSMDEKTVVWHPRRDLFGIILPLNFEDILKN